MRLLSINMPENEWTESHSKINPDARRRDLEALARALLLRQRQDQINALEQAIMGHQPGMGLLPSSRAAAAAQADYFSTANQNAQLAQLQLLNNNMLLPSMDRGNLFLGRAQQMPSGSTVPQLALRLNHEKKPSAAQSPANLDQLVPLLHRKLESFPDKETNAYLTAMRSCPQEVLDKEANVEMFLQTENLDVEAAAKRIIEYWKLRHETFGDKMLRPLDQTGEGGLERKELTVLANGFLNVLPPDSCGCPVLSIDTGRLKKTASPDNIRRCIFYMFLLLAERRQAQTLGATLLMMIDENTLSKIGVRFLERLTACLPLRFKAVHLFGLESISESIVSQIRFGDQVFVHVARSKEEIAKKLEPFEIHRTGLPKQFGGDWQFAHFVQWQELRARIEWKIPLGLSGGEKEAASAIPAFPDVAPCNEISLPGGTGNRLASRSHR